jgi:hypothetical protein
MDLASSIAKPISFYDAKPARLDALPGIEDFRASLP